MMLPRKKKEFRLTINFLLKGFLVGILLGLYPKEVTSNRQQLRLVHNGYEGLLVGISDTVPQDHCNSIIHGLKVRI